VNLKVLVLAAMVTPYLVSTCVHVPVPVVVPIVVSRLDWTIPIGLADDARVCVQTALGAGIDPGDVLPLRCVSAGAIRRWIRAQRWAN
jgi:hypothetical protein